jgi:hypothetical protein
MKAAFLAFLVSAVSIQAADYNAPIKSPDERYVVFLRTLQGDAVFPVIVLRDTRTNREAEVFDCESVGQGTGLDAVWSPDSRHLALTIAMGPATQDAFVYRIRNGVVHQVELLPIPKNIDAPRQGHRGGPSVERWQDSRTVWIADGQKNRSFRYRFTKKGKPLADGFMQHEPE